MLCPIAQTWESTPKQWAVVATVEDRSPTFETVFEMINWLYLLCKCGIKTKPHFEWLLWNWSSLGQLNLEPTRPNGLVGCIVPVDLMKISVKEATHMFFYYIMRSSIPWYCIQHHSSWSRIYIRIWIHKRHSIARPNRQAMGCFLWQFWRKSIKSYRHHTEFYHSQ